MICVRIVKAQSSTNEKYEQNLSCTMIIISALLQIPAVIHSSAYNLRVTLSYDLPITKYNEQHYLTKNKYSLVPDLALNWLLISLNRCNDYY